MSGLGWTAFWCVWTIGGGALAVHILLSGGEDFDRGWNGWTTLAFVIVAGPVLWGALFAVWLERAR